MQELEVAEIPVSGASEVQTTGQQAHELLTLVSQHTMNMKTHTSPEAFGMTISFQ